MNLCDCVFVKTACYDEWIFLSFLSANSNVIRLPHFKWKNTEEENKKGQKAEGKDNQEGTDMLSEERISSLE